MMTSIGESLFRLFLVRETLGKMNSMFYEDYTLLWRRSTRSLLDTKTILCLRGYRLQYKKFEFQMFRNLKIVRQK